MPASPFPFDPVMTGLSLAYANPAYIADQVLPRLMPIMSEKFKYYVWRKDEGYTLPDSKVGRKGHVTEVEFLADQHTGETEDYGLDDFLPMKDIANAEAEGIDPRARAVNGLTGLVLLNREVRVAGLVFDPNQYDAGNKVVLAGTGQWTDQDNSNPLNDIQTGLDAAFVRPNTMTIGRASWSALITHPKIVTATSAADRQAGIVRREQVAELFELTQINVGESRLNQAKKGQAPSYVRVWGDNCLLHYNDPNTMSSEDNFVTFGFTQQRTLVNGVDRAAGSMPDMKRGLEGGEVIRVGEAQKEVISAADVGYFIEDTNA